MQLHKYINWSVTLVFISIFSSMSLAEKQTEVTTIPFISESLRGNALDISIEREVIVVLPPSYKNTPKKRYPVLYVLHGLGGKAQSWFSDEKGQPNLQRALDKLYANKVIEEMIVVVPDSYNDLFLGGWYSNSSAGGNWEDYIIKDLLPFIDNNYRTTDHREGRGIAGHSMGAYGSFKLGIKHSELFSAIYAMSTPLVTEYGFNYINSDVDFTAINETYTKPQNDWGWLDGFYYSLNIMFSPSDKKPFYTQLPVSEKQVMNIKANTLSYELIRYQDQLREMQPVIKIDVGSQDTMLINESREFTALLTKQGIKHQYNEYEGGHGDQLPRLAEQQIFQFFSEQWTN